MNEKLTSAYALYKIKCSSGNVLVEYFPFFARIIIDEKMETINSTILKKSFEAKYGIPVSVTFINQVLGIGVENGSIIKRAGAYIPEKSKMSTFDIPQNDFDENWKKLKIAFSDYCLSNGYELVGDEQLENVLLALLDTHNIKYIVDNDWSNEEEPNSVEYIWFNFLRDSSNTMLDIFEFVALLSASSAYKEALFFTEESTYKTDKWKNLLVYLDSPMVFALLGMDSQDRCDSYRQLLNDMHANGCQVAIFDNNYEEVKGIITRASTWASSTAYDLSKANKVAKFLHDSEMTHSDMLEYCENLEEKLNELGIVIKITRYDSLSNKAQEDESVIEQMVRNKYEQNDMIISEEKNESIRCDVKSIVMIYRERNGKISTNIQNSGHIMLTLNSALANVCKQYERDKSISSGHVPACISADLFGAILWLNSPATMVEYQKKKILADCYSALQPNKDLLKKYVDSLDSARKAGDLDEAKYLFLRSHAVVVDALMNVTKGDYARFDDRTYQEVYDDIVAKSDKKYIDEKIEHEKTQLKLNEREQELSRMQEKAKRLEEELDKEKAEKELSLQTNYEKKCNGWSWVPYLAFCLLPYGIILAIIEIVKSQFSNNVTVKNVFCIILFLIATTVAGIILKKGKALCVKFVKKIIKR